MTEQQVTHNDGPDCCQGKHYEPESTTNDAVTRLSEASYAKDWDSAEDTVYDHTTKEERKGWLRDDEVYNDPTAVHDIIYRLIADVEAGERHLQSLKDDSGDIICDLEDQVKRLEDQVERLDAELHDSAKNVLSLSASLGTKIERVSELEAEVERLLRSKRQRSIVRQAQPRPYEDD